ncbi:MAG: hypothetical protein AMJ93_13740 [Anaerolineae bacterium SM23_84]|nr:MAG: hypothetical protein AMJ93_13740 [Anaerolineae bacterium SM23_84]
MNWVDIIIAVIIAAATVSSLRMGFLRQALSLIGFVVGIYTALTHHTSLARAFHGFIGNATVASVVAFVLILIVVWWAFAMLATLTREALKAGGLAWTDHAMGMIVGLLAGLFFTVCTLLLFLRVPVSAIREAVHQSVLASLIFRVLPHLRQLLPVELHIFTVI